jgi:hypothetical protein
MTTDLYHKDIDVDHLLDAAAAASAAAASQIAKLSQQVSNLTGVTPAGFGVLNAAGDLEYIDVPGSAA